MAIWLAAMLAAAAFPPEDDALPRSLQADDDWSKVDGLLSARVGVWTGRGFNFSSTRTDSTQARSKQETFFSASILGGVQFFDHFVLLGTYEGDLAAKITAQVGGGYLGWREHPKLRYGKGVPDEVLIYAGVLVGRLEVHKADFGNFDRGVGFGGGVALGWTLSPQASVQLYGEYRYLRFDYQRDVLSSDTSIGGNAGWFGLGLDFRF
ncbi:MAG: hypothetical protein HY293_14060 [Planctomycetes bacterium]|nr:hypothetical protein [Planctomycetota bacterium]